MLAVRTILERPIIKMSLCSGGSEKVTHHDRSVPAEPRTRGQGPTVPSNLRTSQQASGPNSATISGITILGIKL